MCETNETSRRAITTIPRPRWARLYGIAFVGLAALTLGNVAVPDGARSPLDALVASAVLVAFAGWIRGNRAALDQQDWCECAADTLTVRVIPSRRPERASRPVERSGSRRSSTAPRRPEGTLEPLTH